MSYPMSVMTVRLVGVDEDNRGAFGVAGAGVLAVVVVDNLSTGKKETLSFIHTHRSSYVVVQSFTQAFTVKEKSRGWWETYTVQSSYEKISHTAGSSCFLLQRSCLTLKGGKRETLIRSSLFFEAKNTPLTRFALTPVSIRNDTGSRRDLVVATSAAYSVATP